MKKVKTLFLYYFCSTTALFAHEFSLTETLSKRLFINIETIIGFLFLLIFTWWYIKKQKKLQSRLTQKTLALKGAQKLAQLGSWEYNVKQRSLTWGPQTYEIFEVSPNEIEVSYEKFLEFIHPEDRVKVDEAYKKSLLKREDYNIIHKVVTNRGNTKYVHECCEHIYDSNGEIIKSVGTIYDVTPLMQTQKELEYSNTLLYTSMNATSDLVFFKDKNYFYIDCNEAFCRFVEKKREEIIGKSDFDIFDEHTATMFRKMDKRMLASQEVRSNIEWITYPDGHGLWVQTQKAPFVYDKASTGILGISRDITKLIEYQKEIKSSESRLHTFIEKNQAIILIINPETGRIIQSNEKARDFYMHTQDELESMYIQDINVFNQQEVLEEMELAIKEKRNFFIFKHRLANKVIKDVYVYSSPILFEGKRYLFSIILDVTQKLKNEERLKLFANVFTNVDEGIVITDKENKIIDVNRAFSLVTGYEKQEVLGLKPSFLKSGKHNEDFYRDLWKELLEKGHWRGEIWNRRKSGEVYPERLTISVIEDDKGEIQYFIGLIFDISQEKANEKQLQYIAFNDALTGLPNRVLFLDRLSQVIVTTNRKRQKLAVVFIDIDGFKKVNDTYGHETGDDLLVKLAQSMKDVIREEDSISRIGGDEFVAVLSGIEEDGDYITTINRLLHCVENIQEIGNHKINISASIGVTLYPQDQTINEDGLLRQADQAMYKAKLAGKNCYHIFDVDEDQSIKDFHKEIGEVREALKNQEFVLHYQPQVNMREGTLVGVEALLRWEHPERGLLFPDSFLPIIEMHSVSIELGEWVIKSALEQLYKWDTQGLHVNMSINISAYFLKNKMFVKQLERSLQSYKGIDPSRLELEILETGALENISYVSKVLSKCRKLGVRTALDDFGTGYSSLTYLRRLAIDTLKIDRSFVMHMFEDEGDLSILEAVIGLANAFETNLVAEGVESKEHGATLIQLGCDVAQGYYIAKPMPAERLFTWLHTWKPDKLWTLQKRITSKDFSLLAAIAKHRIWMQDFENILEHDDYISISLNVSECKFGIWLQSVGESVYGHLSIFARVKELHREVHSLGEDLMKLRADGKKQRAHSVLSTIKQKSEEMLECIESMIEVRE